MEDEKYKIEPSCPSQQPSSPKMREQAQPKSAELPSHRTTMPLWAELPRHCPQGHERAQLRSAKHHTYALNKCFLVCH